MEFVEAVGATIPLPATLPLLLGALACLGIIGAGAARGPQSKTHERAHG